MINHNENQKKNSIRGIIGGITLTVSLCTLLFCPKGVFADPVPQLSDKKFGAALDEIKEEHDNGGVSKGQAERNPYVNKRLILSSEDPDLDPEDYGAVDAIQDRDGNYILQFSTYAATRRAEAKLEKDSATECVEPDIKFFAVEDTTQTVSAASTDWNISMIGMDTYSSKVSSANSGASAVVAVLDTGISFSHPLISGRILTGKAKSYVSSYPVNEDNSSNIQGHGTHVAGIIVQCTPGLNVKILPVRVLDGSGGGNLTDVIDGINYAIQQGADVINLSVSGTGRSVNLEKAIANAVSKGVEVVVASGNDGREISSNMIIPAYISNCIVVGAVDEDMDRASFSNYGNTVDVAAPGTNICSSYITSDGTLCEATVSGTSMAAPHVSAMAAVLGMVYSSYSAVQIEALIQQNAYDLGTSGKDIYYGYGLACVGNGVAAYVSNNNSSTSSSQTSQTSQTTQTSQTSQTTQTPETSETSETAETSETSESNTADTTQGTASQETVTITKTPSKVKAKVKKNKVTVSWKSIKNKKKILKQVKYIQVQYSTDPTFSEGVVTKRVGKKKTKVTLKLNRSTTYYVRIRYVGSTGVSAWSGPMGVRTK